MNRTSLLSTPGQFGPVFCKGGLISEKTYFDFGPIANKRCQITLLSKKFEFPVHNGKQLNKFSAQGSNFGTFCLQWDQSQNTFGGQATFSDSLKTYSCEKLTCIKKISISDFSDKKVKEESAEDFAKYLALSQKNLNQLKQRFLANVDEDLGASKKRSEKLTEIIEDLDSISNGHLEAIVVKKEKVKFQVLQNSSDEESTPKANGK